ncbi:MAG: RHS repeat-associated core domain-containing protein [Actinomycetota bacterium]
MATPTAGAVAEPARPVEASAEVFGATPLAPGASVGWSTPFGPNGFQTGGGSSGEVVGDEKFDRGRSVRPVDPPDLVVTEQAAADEDRAVPLPADWIIPPLDAGGPALAPATPPIAPSAVATFENETPALGARTETTQDDDPTPSENDPDAGDTTDEQPADDTSATAQVDAEPPTSERVLAVADSDGDAPALDGKVRLERPAADADASVELVTLGAAATEAISSAGLAFELTADTPPTADAGADWSLELDLDLFDGVADPSALELAVHTDCNTTGDCADDQPLDTEVDVTAGVLRATLPPEAVMAPADESSTAASKTPRSAADDAPALAPLNAPVALAVDIGPQGANGDFTATPFNALAPWQVGPQTGHAELSYPIPVPPARGHVPDLSLQYSSGLVDALNGSANTQVSRVGVGWSEPGRAVVTREITECDDGRLCPAHGRHDGFSVQFGGVSAPLIRVTPGDDGLPHPQYAGAARTRMWEYKLQTQNDWRVRRVEQPASASKADAANGDAWVTWWEITTGDGTLWVFGRERAFIPTKGSGPATLWPRPATYEQPYLNSLQSARMVFDADDRAAGVGCSGDGTCLAGLSWSLDQVIDPDGNYALYYYLTERNWYLPSGATTHQGYDRSIVLRSIQYGLTYGVRPNRGVDDAAPFRVKFEHAGRYNGNESSPTRADAPNFDCNPNTWSGTPTSWSGNCLDTQTFYTTLRLAKITTIVGGRGADRNGQAMGDFVQQWLFEHSWQSDGSGSSVPMWLNKIRRGGVRYLGANNAGNRLLELPSTIFEHERSVTPDSPGTANGHKVGNYRDSRVTGSDANPFAVPRVQRMVNEAGADVRFYYGQSAPPGTNAANCGRASGGVVVRPSCDAYQDSPGGDWWNKYKVIQMTVNSGTDGSQRMSSAFDYGGTPDWAYRSIDDKPGAANDEGVWADYRGHREVTVETRYSPDVVASNRNTPVESTTSHYLFTGMWDDRFGVDDDALLGEKTPGAAPAVTADSRGKKVPNRQILAGESLGMVERRGNLGTPRGNIQSRDINEFRVVAGTTVNNDALPDRYTKTYVLAGTTSYTEIYNAPKPGNDTAGWSVRTRVDRAFDTKGRLTTEIDHGQYQLNGAAAVVATGDDRTTVITYNEQLGPWIVSTPASTTVRTGASATGGVVVSETATLYDNKGRVTKARTKRSSKDGDWADVDYSYNQWGQVATAIARGGNGRGDDQTTTYAYNNRFGYLAGIDGPLPGKVDASTFVVDPGYNVVIRSTDPDGRVTTHGYDLLGRRTAVRLPGAPNDSYRYAYGTSNGPSPEDLDWVRSARLRTGNGQNPAHYVYSWEFFDGLGRTIQSQSQHPTDNTKMQIASMRYDNMGRIWQETDPTYRDHTVATDGAEYFQEFLKSRTSPPLAFVPDVAHRTYYYPTDATGTPPAQQGWEETRIDQGCTNGFTTRIGYFGATLNQWAASATTSCGLESRAWDRDGKRSLSISDVRGNVTQTVDPAGGTTTFDYNVRDELKRSTSPAGAKTTYTYKKWGIFGPTKIKNPDSGTSVFKYDGHGRLKQQKDGAKRKLKFTYDSGNRPTGIKIGGKTVTTWAYDPPRGSGQVASVEHYNADAAGLSTGKVTTSYAYDNRGRVASTTQSVPGAPGGPKTFSYSYFEDGQMASVTYPGGVRVDRAYDRTARPASLTVTEGPSVFPVVRSVVYNGRGLVKSLQRGAAGSPASLDTSFVYEGSNGRLNSATTTGASGDVLGFAYTYSKAGLIGSITENSPQGNSKQCFAYDRLDRLTDAWTQATAPGCVASASGDGSGPEPYDVAYVFDPDGRITRAAGPGTVNGAYAYDSKVPFHAPTSAGGVSFTYDKGGSRVTAAPAGGGATVYTYDAHARLLATTGAVASSMLYDHTGERVRRTVPGDVDFYFAHGYELDSDGTWRISLSFAGMPVGTYATGRVLWTQTADPLGTSNYAVSSTGEETYRRFLPYGNPRSAASNPVLGGPSDLGFTGQRHDDALDLIYYGARYYDPTIGQFTQPDTLIPNQLHSQDWNRYAYVRNNPITYNDPTGHEPCRRFGICNGITSVANRTVNLPRVTTAPARPAPASGATGGSSGSTAAVSGTSSVEADTKTRGAVAAVVTGGLGGLLIPSLGGPPTGPGGGCGSILLASFGCEDESNDPLVADPPNTYRDTSGNLRNSCDGSQWGGLTVYCGSSSPHTSRDLFGRPTDHVVLGKSDGLAERAEKVGGRDLMSTFDWQGEVLAAVSNPETRISVMLDGLEGSGGASSRVMAAVQRASAGGGSPFDWELMQIYLGGRLPTVDFYEDDRGINNPFG